MVQAIVNLGEHEDRLLTIVRGKFKRFTSINDLRKEIENV